MTAGTSVDHDGQTPAVTTPAVTTPVGATPGAARPRRARVPAAEILDLMEVGDYLMPYTIRAVCILGVADQLADGPRDLEDLSAACGAHAGSLAIALRYLATRGLFEEVGPGRFGLTPTADLLRAGHPFSSRDIFLSPTACTRAMEGLDETLRSGTAGFDVVHGRSMWQHLADVPEDGVAFDKVMSGVTGMELVAVLHATDWSRFGTVVDVGGGNGAFLAGLLSRFASMQGVLFDLSGVVSQAPEVLDEAGLTDRIRIEAGSFLEGPIPSGGDVYVLKRILYSWDDATVIGILSRVRAAMDPGARLMIMEAGRPDGASTPLGRRMDMLMLTLSAGGARTLAQQSELLSAAGLELVRVSQTPMFPVIEARAV